jgi:hypothetical protein
MLILQNIGLGLLGIVFYNLFKSKDYIFAKEFSFSTFLNENFKAWIWSILVIISIVVTITIEPTTKDFLKTFTGLDLTASPAGFFFFGAGLNVLLKKPSERAKAARVRAKEKKISG